MKEIENLDTIFNLTYSKRVQDMRGYYWKIDYRSIVVSKDRDMNRVKSRKVVWHDDCPAFYHDNGKQTYVTVSIDSVPVLCVFNNELNAGLK